MKIGPDFEGIDPADNGIGNYRDRALCAQTDPEIFFPEKGGSTREAKRVCLNCEVRNECLVEALTNDERFGIWGGFSERERRRIKRDKVTVLGLRCRNGHDLMVVGMDGGCCRQCTAERGQREHAQVRETYRRGKGMPAA